MCREKLLQIYVRSHVKTTRLLYVANLVLNLSEVHGRGGLPPPPVLILSIIKPIPFDDAEAKFDMY